MVCVMNSFAAYLALITLFDVIGIFAAKFWIMNKNPWLLFLTVLGFGAAGYFYAHSLNFEGMAIANIMWISFSVIIVTLVGYFGFKEEISLIQGLGILLLIVGLVLINWKS